MKDFAKIFLLELVEGVVVVKSREGMLKDGIILNKYDILMAYHENINVAD